VTAARMSATKANDARVCNANAGKNGWSLRTSHARQRPSPIQNRSRLQASAAPAVLRRLGVQGLANSSLSSLGDNLVRAFLIENGIGKTLAVQRRAIFFRTCHSANGATQPRSALRWLWAKRL
jgi:hypothetical protein